MQRTLNRAGSISLRALLPEARFFGGQDVCFTSCVTDARRCRPGDLYAALVSAERDGHEGAAEAVSRGATAVLGERLLPVNVPVCVVPHSSQAYGRVCQRLAGDPGETLHVTGSDRYARQDGHQHADRLSAACVSAARGRDEHDWLQRFEGHGRRFADHAAAAGAWPSGWLGWRAMIVLTRWWKSPVAGWHNAVWRDCGWTPPY